MYGFVGDMFIALLARMRRRSLVERVLAEKVQAELASVKEFAEEQNASEHYVTELAHIDSEMEVIGALRNRQEFAINSVRLMYHPDPKALNLILDNYDKHLVRHNELMRRLEALREQAAALAEPIATEHAEGE